jgi:hypothetical protein
MSRLIGSIWHELTSSSPFRPSVHLSFDDAGAEGKAHKAATICLARRRCKVILAMVTRGQHYKPAYANEPLSAAA